MFGAPTFAPAVGTDTEVEEEEDKRENPVSLISDQVRKFMHLVVAI